MSSAGKVPWIWISWIAFIALILGVVALGRREDVAQYNAIHDSAEDGDARSQFLLGKIEEEGNKWDSPNWLQAEKWYRMAADQGNGDAQWALAVHYLDSSATSAVPLEWLRTADSQGRPGAAFMLGWMYEREFGGSSSKDDFEEALKWYRKAANRGHGGAQYRLGIMHCRGYMDREVSPPLKVVDPIAAYAWLDIAASSGDAQVKVEMGSFPEVLTTREIAEHRDAFLSVTSEQIAEAQKLSKEILKQIEESKQVK